MQDADKNKTQVRVGTVTVDRKDETLKITEKKTEKLPGNKTKEVLVKEKAEKLPFKFQRNHQGGTGRKYNRSIQTKVKLKQISKRKL